ncbi:MAG: hypothetical protein Q9226_002591 [Calogaya cf. arnoldii]
MVQNQSYDNVRSSRLFHDLLRLLQFLSAIISLGLFSHYLRQVHRRDQFFDWRTRTPSRAVEGILAAATLYTLGTLLLRCLLRRMRAPASLRWLLTALDLAFTALFITVAVLTRPNGGPSGRHGSPFCLIPRQFVPPSELLRPSRLWLLKNGWCKLATGTFALAIISTILHFLTALFPEISEKRRAKADVAGYEMDNNARV